MTENNDKLLADFFAENRQEITDNGFTRRVIRRLPDRGKRLANLWTANGFTRRVIRRLPDRGKRLANLWTAIGFTLAAVLFVALDGIRLIGDALRETFTCMLENSVQADPRSLVIAGLVLLYLMYRKIASLA